MPISLTERDLEILNAINNARYMTAPQIQALFWRNSRGGVYGNLKACQRRLLQLTIAAGDDTMEVMDMLLARRRAADRKAWLEAKGDLAEVL